MYVPCAPPLAYVFTETTDMRMREVHTRDMLEEGGRLIWVSLIAAEVAPHWDPTLGPPLAWICN